MKDIKYSKRYHLLADKTCKKSVVYSYARLEENQFQIIGKINVGVNNPGSLWNEEDDKFIIVLTKIGIDVETLSKETEAPRYIINCLVEYWQVSPLQKL